MGFFGSEIIDHCFGAEQPVSVYSELFNLPSTLINGVVYENFSLIKLCYQQLFQN